MVALDEDAFNCDLLETYGVIDYRALPLQRAATLGLGLSCNSRIRSKQMGLEVTFETFLLAQAVDALHLLCWLNSDDGQKNRNRPPSISENLKVKEPIKDTGQFADADDFETMRRRLLTDSPKEGE